MLVYFRTHYSFYYYITFANRNGFEFDISVLGINDSNNVVK